MQQIFKDIDIQHRFERDGFVVLKLLNQHSVNILLNYYKKTNIQQQNHEIFTVGSDHTNKLLVDEMTDYILDCTRHELNNILINYQAITASYIIKYPNTHGTINPHQDWSFIDDEKEFCSMTCWIPLINVNIKTGCIGAVKGSQHIFKNVRPSPMPYVKTPLAEHNDLLISYLTMISMNAGEALFFNHRCVHASLPNTSTQDRVAIGISIANNNAKMVHFYLNPNKENSTLVYPSDKFFYKKYDNFILKRKYEEGKTIDNETIIDERDYEIHTFTNEELESKLKLLGNKKSNKVKYYLKYLKYLNLKENVKEKLISIFN